MNYGGILKKAWDISWKNKILWLFALFAPIVGTASMNFSSRYSSSSNDFQSFGHNIDETSIIIFIILAIIIGLMIAAISVVLNLYGTSGTILGTTQVIEEGTKPKFKELIKRSNSYILPLFLVKLALIVLNVAIAVGVIIGTVLTLGILLCCLIFLAPVFYLVYIFISFVFIALIKENLQFTDAFTRGWELFRDNFSENVVWTLIIGIGHYIIMIVTTLILLLCLGLVGASIAGIASGGDAILVAGLIVVSLITLVYLAFYIVFNAFMNSYIWSILILVYNEFAFKAEAKSTIEVPVIEEVIEKPKKVKKEVKEKDTK